MIIRRIFNFFLVSTFPQNDVNLDSNQKNYYYTTSDTLVARPSLTSVLSDTYESHMATKAQRTPPKKHIELNSKSEVNLSQKSTSDIDMERSASLRAQTPLTKSLSFVSTPNSLSSLPLPPPPPPPPPTIPKLPIDQANSQLYFSLSRKIDLAQGNSKSSSTIPPSLPSNVSRNISITNNHATHTSSLNNNLSLASVQMVPPPPPPPPTSSAQLSSFSEHPHHHHFSATAISPSLSHPIVPSPPHTFSSQPNTNTFQRPRLSTSSSRHQIDLKAIQVPPPPPPPPPPSFNR